MVEMVIVTPLLLLLLFGIAEFGIAFAQFQAISNAAREGARVGVAFRNPAVCAANALTEVQNAVTNYSAAMIQAAPTINVTGLCAGPPTPVTVTASVPYNFQIVPNIQGLLGGGAVPNVNLVGTSTMRNE